VALLAGTEGEGLPADLMARIRTARIAQAPGMDSLNVATATGIALHHMALAMGRLS
jgi:tRNA G18 (ribose-2'-O)-methylase SpoU